MRGPANLLGNSGYSKWLWVIQKLVLGQQVSFITDDCVIPFPELKAAMGTESRSALGDITDTREDWHNSSVSRKGSPEGVELLILLVRS